MRMGEYQRARDGAHERGERPDAASPRAPELEALLSLQRSAGNRAVGALLARAPDAKTPEKKKSAGAKVTVAGIGVIPLLSFSWDTMHSGSGSVGTTKRGQPSGDVVLTSPEGAHTPKLMQLASHGARVDAEIVTRGYTLTLREALIISYQASNPHEGPDDRTETWALYSEEPELKFEEGG